MIAQKINKNLPQMEVAISYYRIICSLNNIKLSNRQLQLLAFAAVRGSVTNPAIRKDFCETYHSSEATINNMIMVLKRKKLLVKDKNKIKVNPLIALDFSEQAIILKVTLTHAESGR